MTIGLSTAIRDARITVIRDALNSGTLEFYTAPRPATGAAIGGAILLGTLGIPVSSGNVANGQMTVADMTEDEAADASGTAVWARGKDNGGAFVSDFSVGATGSGADIELNDINIVQNGSIDVTGGTITEGNA